MLTYTKIATVTVGSGGSATIDFTNIPQTFMDLQVVISARVATTGNWTGLLPTFNGSTSSFTWRRIFEYNSTTIVSDSSASVAISNASGNTASTFGSSQFYVTNYTSSNYKSFSLEGLSESNSANTLVLMAAGLWSNTAAITSITVTPDVSTTFVEYTTATLYGIGYKPQATGGSISSDGTYWYHAFTSTGLFTPSKNLSCDVLVVAGGGGGNGGAGGGAGGYVYSTSKLLNANASYAATVGGGGGVGAQGANSNITGGTLSLTAAVGGGGANGGSGGSGAGANNGGTPGSATSGQGFAGAAGGVGVGGGGGGAGAVGQSGGSSVGGNGGIGLNTWSTWLSTTGLGDSGYIAGGGGGTGTTHGTGGTGGGGTGNNTTGGAGTANTGGGGGGASTTPGVGGSGVVIVRYKI